MPRRYLRLVRKAPELIFGTRVNGSISTIALTSSGACAAAMVAEPPENECPTMTADRRAA